MELPVNYEKTHYTKRRAIREEYVRVQDGNCYHCKAPLDGDPEQKIMEMTVKPRLYPDGFFKNPVHLHHDHNTGMTLGAVHAHCNAVLWEYHGE